MNANTKNLDIGNLNQYDLKSFLSNEDERPLKEKVHEFSGFLDLLRKNRCNIYSREVLSATGRRVIIRDPFTGEIRNMLMFASNNYLGFADHPYVKTKVSEAIEKYGVGLGGPPLLNGYTKLMVELEERLAALKNQEAAMIFPTGYTANVGLVTALVKKGDKLIYDSLSHASFLDGIRMARIDADSFEHNNIGHLETLLAHHKNQCNNLFVGVEGVYSMDGDIAPLNEITALCKKYGAILLLDDAHGTGVMGKSGSGTAAHFECENGIDITMGTFSKVFAVTGGFLAGSKQMINYMKYFARTYMFSAALPPVTLAAVLAGIDLIEQKPELREQLRENTQYAVKKLKHFGFCAQPEAAIITLKIPDGMDIRKMNYVLHQKGIFLNAIEYPAVSKDGERIRISMMTNHTKKDIDYLANCLDKVWNESIAKKKAA